MSFEECIYFEKMRGTFEDSLKKLRNICKCRDILLKPIIKCPNCNTDKYLKESDGIQTYQDSQLSYSYSYRKFTKYVCICGVEIWVPKTDWRIRE